MTDSQIKDCHILLVGRPATNRLAARLAKALPVEFGTASFIAGGRDLRPSPDGDRRGGSKPAGRRSLGRHLRRLECRGHLDVPQAVP